MARRTTVPPATENQMRFLGALMRHPEHFKRYEFLIDVVWGDDADGGPENPSTCLRVMVFNLRKRLKKHGIAEGFIETAWGHGYRIHEDSREALSALLADYAPPVMASDMVRGEDAAA